MAGPESDHLDQALVDASHELERLQVELVRLDDSRKLVSDQLESIKTEIAGLRQAKEAREKRRTLIDAVSPVAHDHYRSKPAAEMEAPRKAQYGEKSLFVRHLMQQAPEGLTAAEIKRETQKMFLDVPKNFPLTLMANWIETKLVRKENNTGRYHWAEPKG